jgi:hypothetical protein
LGKTFCRSSGGGFGDADYEASSKIVVGQERCITQDPNYALGLQQLTQTMAEEVDNYRVAEAILQEEGLRMTLQDSLEQNRSVERGWLQRIHNLCEYKT